MSVINNDKVFFDQDEKSRSPVLSINHWLRLSDEIVLHVLRQLPQSNLVTVSFVNRRFRDLSRDDSLWTELTLDYKDFQYRQYANSCGQLVERCKKLSHLSISNNSNIESTLEIMTAVVLAKETLKSLYIDSSISNWTRDSLALIGCMSELRCLSLALKIRSSLSWGQDLEEIWKNWNLPHLEELDLDVELLGVDVDEDREILKNLFLQLRKLKVVQMSHANDAVVTALATNNPDLRILSIHDWCDLTDYGILALADSCPDLEELRLNDDLTMCALNHLSASCKKIKYLQLEEIRCEDNEDFEEMLSKSIGQLISLEHLWLRYCFELSDSGVERIVRAARKLKHLRIDVAPKVTESLVQKLRLENPEVYLWITSW